MNEFRTDVVGSLLRPDAWKRARLQLEAGLMQREEFAAIELDCELMPGTSEIDDIRANRMLAAKALLGR